VYALIKKGDTRPHIAAGSELPSPAEHWGFWKVRVRDYEFLYSFWEDGRVSWRELEGPPHQPEFGVWRVAGDALQIEWPQSGESETWDLPLFDEFQTGLAFDTLGMDTDLVAWADVRP
jgi:hypothetical protein